MIGFKVRTTIHLIACFLAAVASAHATAQGAASSVCKDDRALSSAVEAWTRGDKRVYELQQPGLGFSYRYRSRIGVGTVYVYDLGIKDWVQSDPRLRLHLDLVVDGIREYERRGNYSNIVFTPVQTITLSCQEFLFLRYSGIMEGKPSISATLLGVRNSKLLKFRMSLSGSMTDYFDSELAALVQATLADDPTR